MVLKTERELVLEKESTMRISTKRKGVYGTHKRRRERERVEREYREKEREKMMINGDILYEEKIQE